MKCRVPHLVGPVALLLAWTALAQPTEQVLKARYLLNFAEFVEWPVGTFADRNVPLIVGVVGDNQILSELGKMKVRRVAGRSVEIREFTWEELTDKRSRVDSRLRTCHILFVSEAESRVMPLIFRKLKSASVLTVSDWARFALEGGVIEFFRFQDATLIQVNLDAAERASLKVSSQLLRLVKVIYREDSQPRSAP